MQITAKPEGSIRTGVPAIDGQLDYAIRAGSLVLIEGTHEAGKSVLSQHITYSALRTNTNAVAYYTMEHDVKGLVAQMDSLSLYTLDNLLADSFRIYPIRPPFSHRESLKAIYLLSNHISALPERFNLVVIDSISPFVAKLRPMLKTELFFECKKLCTENRTIILVANTHIFDKATFPRIKHLCDYHMALKLKTIRFQSDRPEERVISRIRVLKLHGTELPGKRAGIRFEIQPKAGIQVVPFSKMRI